MGEMPDAEASELGPGIAEALVRFDTGLLSDALESVRGQSGVVVGLHALAPKPRRIAGRAITLELGPARAGSPPRVHLGARAIDLAQKGDVIVVANAGRIDVAAWGGLLSAGAAAAAAGGVVIDGACRDVDEVSDLDLEVFCKGAVPLTARGRIAERSLNAPVRVSGVRVSPGDWVVGDATGVVVLPAESVADVLEAAHRLALRERDLLRAIRSREPVSEVLDHAYETLLEATHEGP